VIEDEIGVGIQSKHRLFPVFWFQLSSYLAPSAINIRLCTAHQNHHHMSKLQLTLPAVMKEPTTADPSTVTDSSVHIDLDNQTAAGGRAIGLDVLKAMVARFHAQAALRPNEASAYIVDKQLLHIILSSVRCTSLLLSKCIRRDGKESIAFTALDKNGVPLGLTVDKTTKKATLTTAGSDIASGEWIGSLTIGEEQQTGILPVHGIEQVLDFTGYLSLVQEKGAAMAANIM
jgi:hypothetical protein